MTGLDVHGFTLGAMAVEPQEFRRAMGRLATGVTVVTTRDADDRPVGLTANSVTSVSLEPPLILFCIDKAAECYAAFVEAPVFAVNVLSTGQDGISTRFATRGGDKFEGVAWRPSPRGCAWFDDAMARFECQVTDRHDAGDHTILVGRVERLEGADAEPLLFFAGRYRRLAGE